jgi:outer membrane protein TolC
MSCHRRPLRTRTALRRRSRGDFPETGAPWGSPCRFASGLCLLLCLLVLGLSAPVAAAPEDKEPASKPAAPGPLSLSFDDSVRLAIHQSPYFTKSSLDIELRGMDETDSRYSMVPTLNLRTLYYANRPSHNNSKPYQLSFTTEPYNPMGAYFTLQAQKLATRLAILAHLDNISKGIMRLGGMFLELDYLQKVASFQTKVVDTAKENLIFCENRVSIGTGTSLELKLASQELQLARNEQQQIAFSRKKVLSNLRNFLGLKSNQELNPDLRDVRSQVLSSFDAAAASLEQAKSRSYELKALEVKKELQGYNILQAKTRLLPRFMLTIQNPDPLNTVTNSGMYAGIGFTVPVWDGFKRYRNIGRQKTILRQMSSDKELKEADLEDRWMSAQQDLQTAASALKIAQSQEELAHLKERQSEIRYHSGGEPLPTMLEGQKGIWQAKKAEAMKSMDYAKAALSLRQLSGDLGNAYVQESSLEK